MAELTTTPTACCSPQAQTSCCEPAAKSECCGTTDGSCGCDAGASASADAVRERVREKYAAAARASTTGASGCGCSPGITLTDSRGDEVFGPALYAGTEMDEVAGAAIGASLGCGVPTAVADLNPGEVVLDLGSGAGADVLISARRVQPGGHVIGLDMTDEMLELAQGNAAAAGVENVTFVKGHIEDIPLATSSVDVVISNCVINLSVDKGRVLRETARVLRPGGRFAVSDVIADEDMDEGTRADMRQWTGCIAGALTESEFRDLLTIAGFTGIEIRPTHRVHDAAQSAIIRARKPA